ncbi:MAG: hypothetical protein ACXQS3_06555 [Candidatus Methanofastidiosia archaeon]
MMSSKNMLQEVIAKYNKDPLGWHVALDKDARGRTVAFIQKDKSIWQIKTHHMSPYKSVSVAGKTKGEIFISRGTISFGWRSLSAPLMYKIRQDITTKGDLSKELLGEIESIDPQPVDDAFKSVLEGPITFSNSNMAAISEKQKNLDKRLTKELDKLILYADGSSMYV